MTVSFNFPSLHTYTSMDRPINSSSTFLNKTVPQNIFLFTGLVTIVLHLMLESSKIILKAMMIYIKGRIKNHNKCAPWEANPSTIMHVDTNSTVRIKNKTKKNNQQQGLTNNSCQTKYFITCRRRSSQQSGRVVNKCVNNQTILHHSLPSCKENSSNKQEDPTQIRQQVNGPADLQKLAKASKP